MIGVFIKILKYNNITPIIVVFVLLGTGAAFASEDVRHAVIGERIEETRGVDNSALLSFDTESYNQEMRITDVAETDDEYSISYEFNTFDVREYDWGDVVKESVLVVDKEALGERDLGLYVEKELAEVMDAHLAYIKKAKTRAEETGRTVAVKTTEYTKLTGLVLNATSKKLDGYEPVKEKPVTPPSNIIKSQSSEQPAEPAQETEPSSEQSQETEQDSTQTEEPEQETE